MEYKNTISLVSPSKTETRSKYSGYSYRDLNAPFPIIDLNWTRLGGLCSLFSSFNALKTNVTLKPVGLNYNLKFFKIILAIVSM